MNIEGALLHAAPSGGSKPAFAGKWKNELGSVMDLTVDGQKLRGTYTSSVSADGKKVSGDLAGFIDGDLISFVVNWTGQGSLTAWVGQMVGEGGKERIATLWHLALNAPEGPQEPNKLWQAVLAGADNFKRA